MSKMQNTYFHLMSRLERVNRERAKIIEELSEFHKMYPDFEPVAPVKGAPNTRDTDLRKHQEILEFNNNYIREYPERIKKLVDKIEKLSKSERYSGIIRNDTDNETIKIVLTKHSFRNGRTDDTKLFSVTIPQPGNINRKYVIGIKRIPDFLERAEAIIRDL